jgi:hypothetical protein
MADQMRRRAQAVKEHPDSSNAWFDLGVAYMAASEPRSTVASPAAPFKTVRASNCTPIPRNPTELNLSQLAVSRVAGRGIGLGACPTSWADYQGEAMLRGPVILSWPDVAASADWESAGMNLVIHEFAHKLDMRNGVANGCPPLPAEMPAQVWKKTMLGAYEHFQMRVDRGDRTAIDPYAAESPAEFFAVLSEAFFELPDVVQQEYPGVYEQLSLFYRQDPLARLEKRTRGRIGSVGL